MDRPRREWLSAHLFLAAALAAVGSFAARAEGGASAPRIRLVLLFDDGPSIERCEGTTPTGKVLDILKTEGVKAAFFVLTGEETALRTPRKKAETALGYALLEREIREGHVVGCHFGGEYRSQKIRHDTRVALPPYDYDGDGLDDYLGEYGNALETDLLQCKRRIGEAYRDVKSEPGFADLPDIADDTPWFVKPPLGVYNERVLRTYDKLRLKMILADGWMRDAGYVGYPFCGTHLNLLMRHVLHGIAEGRPVILLTLHDSNARTAVDLPRILAHIRKKMAAKGYVQGADWDFVRRTDELIEILRSVRTFRGERGLTVQDIRQGWRNHDQ